MILGRRGRLALKLGGYALLALVTFLYAVHLTFPYERVRDRFVEAMGGTYDVTVNGVERSLVPGRFALKGVTLASRAKVVGQPVTTMYFSRIELDLKILPLLGKRIEIGLDVRTGAGAITGTVSLEGRDLTASLELRRVPLATLPGISDAVGLPMDGNADGAVSLRLVNGDWSKKTTGRFELSCSVGCSVGDGVTKIYPKPQRPSDAALYRDGMTVPKVLIDRFKIVNEIKNGVSSLKTFEFVSPAGKVEVDYDIKLARAIGNSTIEGCIRYQCSAEFQREHPGLCIGSPIVDEQGMMNIKLTSTLARMRRLPQRCDTGARPTGDSAGAPLRPTLETIPEPTAIPEITPMPPSPDPPQLEVKPMADDVGGSVPPMPPPPMPPPPMPPTPMPPSTETLPSSSGSSMSAPPPAMLSPSTIRQGAMSPAGTQPLAPSPSAGGSAPTYPSDSAQPVPPP